MGKGVRVKKIKNFLFIDEFPTLHYYKKQDCKNLAMKMKLAPAFMHTP